MFLWIFFFISLYFLVDQALYCHRKRRDWDSREQQIGLGLLCALINGISAFSIQDGGYHSAADTGFALLLILLSSLICCRYSYQIKLHKYLLSGKLSTFYQLYQLHQEGRLMKLPCPQGQTVYWIDSRSSPPAVHTMQFVTKLNHQYIGTYGRSSCLVLVDRIYLQEKEAEEVLRSIRFDLYSGV